MSPRRNWDSPTPSLASECAPPPRTAGGGGEGLGESYFRRLEKKLSTLPIHCAHVCLSSWHALYAEAGGVAGHQGGVPTGEEGRGVDGEDRRLRHHEARPLGDFQLS